jgi:Zinc carboxypeptidase
MHLQKYLDYAELTQTIQNLQKAHPAVCKVSSIGKTPEGRELWLLTIGKDLNQDGPSVWVDGNMHATELCGSNVALEIAARAIHIMESGEDVDIAPHLCQAVQGVRFFILPRMCPDGAEVILKEGRYLRSNPRDGKLHPPKAKWRAADLDGDGLSLSMRVQSTSGDFVESKVVSGFMLPREQDDVGPFYKMYPEARIDNFQGEVPAPSLFDQNDTDLNRNFPYNWQPEPKQAGAGNYAASEPESRAVVEFTSSQPTLFAWLNLHTFGGVFIRPLGDGPDTKMNETDLAVFRQIGEDGERITTYPMVSGFEDFLYKPDTPLYGDLTDYAFHQRGTIAYVCELWDIFARLGVARKKPFSDVYAHLTRIDWENFAKWDQEKNASRVIRPWKKVSHPELGEVEVGGLDPRVGISNPPYEEIAHTCRVQSHAFLRVAAMSPKVNVRLEKQESQGDVHVLSFVVENTGYLPTYVLESKKDLSHATPLYAQITTEGPSLLDENQQSIELGHLEGYGKGLYSKYLFFQRSDGSSSEKRFRISVRGKGTLHVRVGCPRVGKIETTVNLS